MAKDLQPGDKVTVKVPLEFSADSEPYQQGIQTLTPDQIGKVVKPGEGRSVIVDFKGIQIQLSKQSLELNRKAKPRGRPKATAKLQINDRPDNEKIEHEANENNVPAPEPQAKTTPNANTKLITLISNKLISSGKTAPERDTVIEIHLADLSDDAFEQITQLIQAKLDLSL